MKNKEKRSTPPAPPLTKGGSKGEMGVVEQAKKDMQEIDEHKQRQEVKEGAEARDKLAVIQTKEQARLIEIGAKYLDGTPYEKEMVIGRAQAYLKQSVMGIIGAGKCFLAMKEAEMHGGWEDLIEKKIGISPVTVWRFMAIARKFEIFHAVKDLTVSYDKGIGKLYSLLNIPDEELAEFDETGLFKGATVEEINKMSVKDFRKLIAEKEDWKAKAKQFELEVQTKYDTKTRYEKKIDSLEKEKKGLQEKIDDFGLSKDDKEALTKIQNLKLSIRGNINFIEAADLRGHSDEVKAELLSLATYIHDRGELCLGRVLEIVGNVDGTVAKEAAERDYLKKYGEDNE